MPPCKNKEIMFMLVRVQTCTIWIGTMHVWWWGLIRFTISISCSVWIVDYFGILWICASARQCKYMVSKHILEKDRSPHDNSCANPWCHISPKTYLMVVWHGKNPLGPRDVPTNGWPLHWCEQLWAWVSFERSVGLPSVPTWSTISRSISSSRLGLNIEEIDDVANLYPEGSLAGWTVDEGWLGLWLFWGDKSPRHSGRPNILETCISESGSLQELLQVDQLTMNYLTVSRIHEWHSIYHMCIYTYICIHMYGVHVYLITYVHICSIISSVLFIYDIIAMLWIPLNSFEFHISTSFTAALVLGFTEPGHFSGFQHGFGFWIPRPPILQRLQHKTSSAWCQPCSSTSEGSDRPWKWKRVNDPKIVNVWWLHVISTIWPYCKKKSEKNTSNQNFKPL